MMKRTPVGGARVASEEIYYDFYALTRFSDV